MIINRPFWQKLIETCWQQRSIIWLVGVRRVGKTTLCQSLPDIEYIDCERPTVQHELLDPEVFLARKAGKRLVLDEIHCLNNPSQVLKLAADHYPTVKIIATGSSTLGASSKFSDTLTGRKLEVFLTPLLLNEQELFGGQDLAHRFLCGGLPQQFTASEPSITAVREWISAYWARDIQELFRVNKFASFKKCIELLFMQSGGIFEANKFAVPCEVTRQTIASYVGILEVTNVICVVKPYAKHAQSEITHAPKVYAFDTGFVCAMRGWQTLRPEDYGLMWEHCVLNELLGALQLVYRNVHYWRDRAGHEIDFVLRERGHNDPVTAIECKYRSHSLGSLTDMGGNFAAFRKLHPHGKNYVVATDVTQPYNRECEGITLTFVNPQQLIDACRETVLV